MVKRKETEAVTWNYKKEPSALTTWRKWHKNHAPSLCDVVAAFSSSQCEDACGMLTPTNAELLSAHYISGDLVNECAVTRRMSELMSRGLKVVCSQRCLSPTPLSTPPRSPPHGSTPPRSPTPRSPPPHSPSHGSTPPRSPTPRSTPHGSPSRLQRLEDRRTVVEAKLTMMLQQQAHMMDILKILQSDMLSFKSPVITTGGETAERAEKIPSTDSPDGFELALSMLPLVSEVTWTGSPEVAGWTKVARMFQLSPVREEESGSRESTPEAVKKLSILDSNWSVDSNGNILLDLITPLARMMPHILVAMGVQTGTYTVTPNPMGVTGSKKME
ncbi:NAC domain-containing protein 105-like [Dorcoceras hygrometricum]|uniref:NAC domain-containing protein 105-like n=1 Tax=Dorcoceras hygrometricum TaxID=472368 RepID=A0A2Z7C8I6_9LAMI|nr:NAC domain-containing protein 105-like [Dorcoceras hygrometricum]